MSKARVTPIKVITIPRLELTAATLSAKASIFLEQELQYNRVEHFFYTDSRTILGYIGNNDKRFQIFVANWVQQIRDVSTPRDWRYVQTGENPADIVSRGYSPTELIDSTLWWHGPAFLMEPKPHMPPVECDISPEDPEVKQNVLTTQVARGTQDNPFNLDSRLLFTNSWHRARKAVALCLWYKQRLS